MKASARPTLNSFSEYGFFAAGLVGLVVFVGVMFIGIKSDMEGERFRAETRAPHCQVIEMVHFFLRRARVSP